MSHLEHADDMAIVSYSPEGLQRHLETFSHWCGNNLLEVNASKSWMMIFGPVLRPLPYFTLNGHSIGYMDCLCYVGVTFQSMDRNVFSMRAPLFTELLPIGTAAGPCRPSRYTYSMPDPFASLPLIS
jgi:hypothetical protein